MAVKQLPRLRWRRFIMAYIIPEGQHFPAKVSNFSQPDVVICNIMDKLNEDQLETFSRSCFGMYLRIKSLTFSWQIVHQLLLRQVESSNHSFGTTFNFRLAGKQAAFSFEDFALVIGLVCTGIPPISSLVDTSTQRLRDAYFKGNNSIKRSELESTFLGLKPQLDNEDDVVKLALVYFVEFVLLGRERSRNISDVAYLQLVENLDEFNKYPWGSVSYTRTSKSLAGAMKGRVQNFLKKTIKPTKTQKEQYSLYGFLLTLQIWSYEAIPLIGRAYAQKDPEIQYPRILNWSTSITPDSTELILSVFRRKQLQVHGRLIPTQLEMAQEYCKKTFDVLKNVVGTMIVKVKKKTPKVVIDEIEEEEEVQTHRDIPPVTEKYVLRDNIANKIDVFDSLLKDHSKKHKDLKVEVCLMLQFIEESMGTLLEVVKKQNAGNEWDGNGDVNHVIKDGDENATDGPRTTGKDIAEQHPLGQIEHEADNAGKYGDGDATDGQLQNREAVIFVESQEVPVKNIEEAVMEGEDAVSEDVVSPGAEDDIISMDIAATSLGTPNKMDMGTEGVEIITPSKFPVAKEGGVIPYVSNKEKRNRKLGSLLKTLYTNPTKNKKLIHPPR
ncbi:uncharacterized protein LOC119990985 [Tripterygium wilfordii]|uniref:uncharacterized protein LOC119990985 n=1 Tax=Tripterygium wilfordii TaxID=458696 RepID=UPI0018F7F09A|nr:uncharacterized protein LOC119990985 [Tripterygium wilfordii]